MPPTLTAPATITYKIRPTTNEVAAAGAYQEGMDLFRSIYFALILCLTFCAMGAALVTLAVASI